MNIINIIILSVICAIMYRMGGSGSFSRWIRPAGVGICLLTLLMFFKWHWTAVLSSGVSAGLSTTYFKKSGTDATWKNWLLVGLALSIGMLPYALATHNYIGFGIRTVILTAGITLWSEYQNNAVLEELGRGFLIIITMLAFLIGG